MIKLYIIKRICNIILFSLITFIIIVILMGSYYRRYCPYCGKDLQFVPPLRAVGIDLNKSIYNGSNCPYCKCKLQYKDIKKKWIWEDYND